MAEPYVRLVNICPNAYDNFIATARTCYSARGIVGIEDVAGPPDAAVSELERRRERKHALGQSIFKAGHHTTLQHAHAQFALDRVSRHFIWSFLHSHPFYNSEQVSQRYVEVKEENFHIPDTVQGRARDKYMACVRRQMGAYHDLCETLRPLVAEQYYERFRGRHGSRRAESDIKRKSQEVARYVLPVATYAYLYHTVSIVTLLRYHRVAQEFDTSAEQRAVVGMMVDALLEREPDFRVILQQPMPIEDTPEYRFFADRQMHEVDMQNAARVTAEFDERLEGKTSVLVDWSDQTETVLADSIRQVLGLAAADLDIPEAIATVLDPARNRLLGEPMSLATLSKLSRTLCHPRYTFIKKLSHAADSQDQRHRLTPGSRPILMRHFSGTPDFVTPLLVTLDDSARQRYVESMQESWDAVNDLLLGGEAPEDAAYLLPNAVSVRFTESGDLLNLHHKMAMRLCFNAQEEIWQASLDEADAISRVHPSIGRWLLPPCSIRQAAGIHPVCPEGDRYCGVTVWRLQRNDYARII